MYIYIGDANKIIPIEFDVRTIQCKTWLLLLSIYITAAVSVNPDVDIKPLRV